MNSLKEQIITWNEQTTNVIRSVFTIEQVCFLTIQRYLYFDIGSFERRTGPILCSKVDRKVVI